MVNIKSIQALSKELNLLYVEDEPSIREQLKMLLGDFFKTLYVGENGNEGLNLYKEHKDEIDLIITDIKMPEMNGLDMARAIRELDKNVHIIVVTAYNDLEFFSQAIDVGVDGFIIKPIKGAQLMDILYKSSSLITGAKELKKYQSSLEDMLKLKSAELEKTYTHDLLTGCFNREKLRKDIRDDKENCLMLVDIDNFDTINSTYGYKIGDQLLIQFADFLKETTQTQQNIYRLAGDEFVILWKNSCDHRVVELSSRINNILKDKIFVIATCNIRITCTIGIADDTGNAKDGDGEDILKKAHAAIKEIREIGKSRFHIYSPDSFYIAKQKNNITWMHKVREALENDAIIPYYQVIVDNETQKPVKYECLSRIRDAAKIITPNHFIEPARLVGLLPRVTQVMMAKSFAYFANKPYGFTLNITEDDLKEGFMPILLEKLIKQYDINPSRVTLEILENISAQGSEEVLEQLKEFKAMGFLLALDDFGSDKSNFYRLQKMDVDILKIDGSFIKDITTNINNEKITKTIVSLAESMGCDLVAEFVHSKEVFEKVKSLGVKYSQGYYFGEPKPEILT